jgi:hypothetical protein
MFRVCWSSSVLTDYDHNEKSISDFMTPNITDIEI